MKRAALDYGPLAHVTRHDSWEDFTRADAVAGRRLILFTTKGAPTFPNYVFRVDDILLMGSESHGAPPHVHDAAAARLRVPIIAAARSLNLVTAAALALGEALRQTDGYPPP